MTDITESGQYAALAEPSSVSLAPSITGIGLVVALASFIFLRVLRLRWSGVS